MFLFAGIIGVVAFGWYGIRYANARRAATQWLAQHHYRVHSLKMSWFNSGAFEVKWLRNSDNMFTFAATVDDSQLGGSGKVVLRVWTNWLGEVTDDVEEFWETMPESRAVNAPKPLWERLADAQLSALHRIADGETAFYAPRRGEGSQSFDQLIEHVQALAQRGMITCGEPRSDGRNGARITSVGDLRITDEGRRWLESQLKG